MKISRTHIVFALILAAGIVVSATGQEGQGPQEKSVQVEDYLPDGDARNLILQGCVQCHELRNTVSQRKTATGWRRTVNEMIWRGAQLTTDEAEIITGYLAVSFGADKPIPDVFKKKSVTNKP